MINQLISSRKPLTILKKIKSQKKFFHRSRMPKTSLLTNRSYMKRSTLFIMGMEYLSIVEQANDQ